MKNKENRKLNMYLNVNEILEKNIDTWGKIPELKNAYNDFVDNVKKITGLKKEQEKDTKSIRKLKENTRINLIDKLFPVKNILEVYAYDRKKTKPIKNANISRNKLLKNKDSLLIDTSKSIWKKAEKLYSQSVLPVEKVKSNSKKYKDLTKYGLSDKILDELDKARKEFSEVRLKYKNQLSDKKMCTKKINSLLKQTNRLLKKKIDKLMVLVERENPQFFKKYKESRKIKKITVEERNIVTPKRTVQQDIPKQTETTKKTNSPVPVKSKQPRPTPQKPAKPTVKKKVSANNKPKTTRKPTVQQTTP